MKSMALQLIKETITVTPFTYSVPEETDRALAELRASAEEITQIATPEQNAIAGQVAKRLRQTIKDIEAVRLERSRPLDAAKDKLIELERSRTVPLKQLCDGIEALGKQFIESERRRVAEEERKRQEEIARLERERIAKEQAIEEERLKAERERQRLADEAAAKAAAIKNKAKREAFEAEQRRMAEERAKKDAEDEQARIEAANAAEIASRAAIVAPLPEVQRTRGQTVKKVLRWEVTDIAALYAARPDLCKPVEVKPSAVQATCVPERPVPGLKLWWEESVIYTSR